MLVTYDLKEFVINNECNKKKQHAVYCNIAPHTVISELLFQSLTMTCCLKIKQQNDEAFMHTHTHNHFTALLDFVRDYLGEPAPER